MRNKLNLKKSTVACSLLLAVNLVGAPLSHAAKVKPGIFYFNSVTLDLSSQKKLEICPKLKNLKALDRPRPSSTKDILSLAFDPKKKQQIGLQFKTSPLPVSGQDKYVLGLFSSRCLSNKPRIQTPNSKRKLVLDTQKDLKVLSVYDLPAAIQKESTPRKNKTMTLNFTLNTDVFADQLKKGNDTFYLQGALLKKADLKKQEYGDAVLSPLEVIHITANQCPTEPQLIRDLNSKNDKCKK